MDARGSVYDVGGGDFVVDTLTIEDMEIVVEGMEFVVAGETT